MRVVPLVSLQHNFWRTLTYYSWMIHSMYDTLTVSYIFLIMLTNFWDMPISNNLNQIPFLYTRSNALRKSINEQYSFFLLLILQSIIDFKIYIQSIELLFSFKPNWKSVRWFNVSTYDRSLLSKICENIFEVMTLDSFSAFTVSVTPQSV